MIGISLFLIGSILMGPHVHHHSPCKLKSSPSVCICIVSIPTIAIFRAGHGQHHLLPVIQCHSTHWLSQFAMVRCTEPTAVSLITKCHQVHVRICNTNLIQIHHWLEIFAWHASQGCSHYTFQHPSTLGSLVGQVYSWYGCRSR